jgi:hypothetical protein
MLVEHPIELDLPNQGNRLIEPIRTIIDVIRRRAPLVTNCIGIAIAAWRKLDAQLSHALADHHRNREVIENDLFRNRFKIGGTHRQVEPAARHARVAAEHRRSIVTVKRWCA